MNYFTVKIKVIFISLTAFYLVSETSCKKTETFNTAHPYYLSFEHDSMVYNLNVDSSTVIYQQYYNDTNHRVSIFDIHKLINGGSDLDSARKGLIKLASLDLRWRNYSLLDTGLLGRFTTDTLTNNYRQIFPNITHITIYSENDSKKGHWIADPSLPFTITINTLNKNYIEGIFNGMLKSGGNVLTISNGKFKIPI